MLSLYRGRTQDAFGHREHAILRRLTHHVIVAIDTYWKTQVLALGKVALAHTLDAVTIPLILIDRVGRIVFANDAAEAALRTGECLRIVDGSLVASSSVQDPKACAEALRSLRAGRAGTVWLTVGSGRAR